MAKTTTDTDRITRKQLADLVVEYRDKMLESLGVVEIEYRTPTTAPGEEIRRIPIRAGTHDGNLSYDDRCRVLTDVSDYEGETEIANHDETQYVTAYQTAGTTRVSEHRPTTYVIGWDTIPTPREIRIAEYLQQNDRSDVTTSVKREHATERITRIVYPSEEHHPGSWLWCDVSNTTIEEKQATKSCVTALKYGDDDPGYQFIRYRDDYDGDLEYRIGCEYMTIESYFDNPSGEYRSEWWAKVYAGHRGRREEVDEVEHITYGSVAGEYTRPNGKKFTFNTRLVTIPELKRPEHVLDIPAPEPIDPRKDGE